MSVKEEYLGSGVYAIVSDFHGFGTDALMLAYFAAPKTKDRACDLGSGCGIIPLLWFRDKRCAKIAALELQPQACTQLRAGIEISSAEDKIQVIQGDLRSLKGVLSFGEWDLVTINPPYKALDTGIKSREKGDLIARHEVSCTLEEACAAAASLLRFGGRFCLCQRPERLSDIFAAMRAAGMEPKRMRQVALSPGRAPWLVLVEGRRGGKPGLIMEPELLMQNADGSNTEEMLAVFGEYYVNDKRPGGAENPPAKGEGNE